MRTWRPTRAGCAPSDLSVPERQASRRCRPALCEAQAAQRQAHRWEKWKIIFAAGTSSRSRTREAHDNPAYPAIFEGHKPKSRDFLLPLSGYFYGENRVLELNDSAAETDGNGFCSIAGTQFFHDVFDVNLNRFLGNRKFRGDVAVSVSVGKLGQNLDFASG